MKKYTWITLNVILLLIASVFIHNQRPIPQSSVQRMASMSEFSSIVKRVSKNMSNDMYFYFNDGIARNDMAEKAPSHSTTNVQIEGVDEADTLKTNGNQILFLSNNSLFIYQAYPIDSATLHSKTQLDEDTYYSAMFLYKNYVVLMGVHHDMNVAGGSADQGFGNRIAFWGTPYVKTVIYDISNVEKPQRIYSLEVEGYYVSARLVEDQLTIISQKGNYFWRYGMSDNQKEPEDVITKIKENGIDKPVDVTDIFIIGEPETLDMVNLTKMSLGETISASTSSIMGNYSTVMATKDTLYLASAKYSQSNDVNALQVSSTEIIKIDYRRNFDIKAQVTVSGTLINQFAMDEYEGYLRIATTTNIYVPATATSKTTNQVMVLDRNLRKAGTIENIADNEQIYSVRFNQDRGYLVTFEQVDPFFVIDLSNPSNPKILGELKIPGFSTYLHKVNDEIVMGLGQNVLLQDDRLTMDGLKISLFNVSDELNPTEIDSYLFKNPYSYSEALYNHTALLTYPKMNLFGFLYTDYSVVSSDSYGLYQHSLFVFTVENNKINVLINQSSRTYSSQDNTVERLVIIDDALYLLSYDQLSIVNLSTTEIIRVIKP